MTEEELELDRQWLKEEARKRHEVMSAFVREMRSMNDPQPGYWLIRVTKGGPLTPARIWFERDPEQGEPEPWSNAENRILGVFAEIAGRPADPERVWFSKAIKVIDQAEYEFLVKDLAWARRYQPSDPITTPEKPVSIQDAPLPF